MGCFCATAMEPLASQLARLREPAETAVEPGAAQKVTAVSDWRAARTLPAEPWQPDPAWQDLQLPTPLLPPGALATISGLAHLRAQALSQFGTDLLDPAQADGFTRIIATMNDRFRRQPLQRVDAREWMKLAAQNDAADRVAKALKDSLLKPSPEQLEEYNEPGGVPIRQWGDLLRPLRRLAPLIAAARQFDADVTDPAQLADALCRLSRLKLPRLEAPEQMQELSSAISAVQRLRSSLRENPLERGIAHARAGALEARGRGAGDCAHPARGAGRRRAPVDKAAAAARHTDDARHRCRRAGGAAGGKPGGAGVEGAGGIAVGVHRADYLRAGRAP
jgi:hypothetical protein